MYVCIYTYSSLIGNMFSMLQPVIIHLYFIFTLALLLPVGSNCLTISSSHHREGLLSSYFCSFGYHSTTALVQLQDV